MLSDFIVFFQNFFNQSHAGSIIPQSLKELMPVDTFTSLVSGMNNTLRIGGAIVFLVLALIACFLGYKLSRLFMTITGFIAGAILGYLIGAAALKLDQPLLTLAILTGAVLLSVFSYRIYVGGIFILCFMLAFVAAASILPFNGDIQFFLSTLIGFIVGSLSIKYIRPVIILSSAIVGGVMAGSLIPSISSSMNVYTFSRLGGLALTALICILGIVIQFFTTSDEDEEKRKQKKLEKKIRKQERKRLEKQNAHDA